MDRKKFRTIFIFCCFHICGNYLPANCSKLPGTHGYQGGQYHCFFRLFIWGIGLAVLLKNLSAMMCWALDETAVKMYGEETFFSKDHARETPQSLVKKFKNARFVSKGEYLHKRRFSVSKDYINYYLITVEEPNMEQHFQSFLESYDNSPPDRRRFRKNNVYYMVCFSSVVPDEALEMFKTCIVNQDMMQDLSSVPYVFLPLVYDTRQGKYIIRHMKGRFSINYSKWR